MDDEVIRYKKILETRNIDKPIWEKKCLSIEEAAAYSGIGITKLRQLSRTKEMPVCNAAWQSGLYCSGKVGKVH